MSSVWRAVPVFAKACFKWLRAVFTLTPRVVAGVLLSVFGAIVLVIGSQ